MRLVCLATSMTAACVLPPDLSVDTSDGGVNSPPAITAVRSNEQELPEPGPVNFVHGPTAGMMSVALIDTDVEDRLFVSLFVDYFVAKPTPPRAECEAAPTGSPQRTATCDLTALCFETEVDRTEPLFLTIQVFDRKPLETGAPRFKLMPEGGMTTSRGYLMNCDDPS